VIDLTEKRKPTPWTRPSYRTCFATITLPHRASGGLFEKRSRLAVIFGGLNHKA
jgi:hypothetical protein